jgi:nitroreductase
VLIIIHLIFKIHNFLNIRVEKKTFLLYYSLEDFLIGGFVMNATECIKGRRSIRKFKNDKISHSLLESIISTSSFTPSWKNTQITRYIAIEDTSIIQKIANDFTPDFNANIIRQVSTLIAVTFIKGRCGFERDGSFSTKKEDRWQMFDVGAACQTFCLAAHEAGLGTVIMGIWDEDGITELLDIPETQELAALIAIGYPDVSPVAPKRKSVDDLLTYR